MNMEFQNELGTVVFSGTSHPGGIRMTGISGLALAPRTGYAVKYVSQQGQKTVSIDVNARVITVGCDVEVRSSAGQALYAQALLVLDRPGDIFLSGGGKKRRIGAYVSSFEEGERLGPYRSFAVQFTCDDPYFTDFQMTSEPVYMIEKCISTPFVLPCVFSRRISRRNVENLGHVPTEPVFIISNSGSSTAGDVYGIEIYNHTTRQSIKLLYNIGENETVTIDIAQRSITGANGQNLLDYISDDTALGNFYLACGANDIELINLAALSGLSAQCRFYNKYVEAVC